MRTRVKFFLQAYIFPVLGIFLSWYIRFVYRTSRVKLDLHPKAEPYFKDNLPAIYAFWHGRLLMIPTLYHIQKNWRMHVLVSRNAVGVIADACVRRFNIQLIRGSARNPKKPHQDKGGSEALKEMLRLLKKGDSVSLTPDGPLGPIYHVNKGVVITSMLSQAPIIPLTYTARYRYIFKSWDKFMLPFPFNRLYFKISEPIFPSVDYNAETIEHMTERLKDVLCSDLDSIE